jgi:hypothetical protein
MPERLLVTGSRLWTDERAINQQIRLTRHELEVVIEGEAPGADTLARQAAERYGVPVLRFPADWKTHGRAAGPIRNERMLREGRPTAVVAFTDDFQNPRSGTRHMCRIAVEAGVPVTLVEHAFDGCCSRDLTQEDFEVGVARA